ncbi:MAG: amino acid ABC transporter permease [Firmicutes bacterium]|jgi:polar amino acid transport system permease protein|nr:amino acid ABC transporter permease [Bacillota bacterium]MBQ2058375.1 amino acid ABC transporter permease [Bacillota bacterium]MBQ4371253.1 amino acid ABC transporter permease [Bacillota bacterium]
MFSPALIAKIWLKYYPVFLQGLWGTLWISAVTVVAGTVIGVIVSLLRLVHSKLIDLVCSFYIELIRGTPILLQLYFFWLWLPKATGLDLSNLTCILVALVVSAGAYIAEVIRAGIEAVDRGQTEAARSLGLTETQTLFHVVLPQAVKNVLPALGNEFITNIKQSSLASQFFIAELTTAYRTVQTATFMPIPPLIVSGMIYLIVNFSLSKLLGVWERRLKASD